MQELTLALIILVGIALLVSRAVAYEVTAVLIIAALAVTGLLSFAEAASGLSSSAFMTVAAMFVVSAGLQRTGALEILVERLASLSGGKAWRLTVLLALVVPFASAFMNNTAVVVLFIPVLLVLSRRFAVAASKFMMPLSFLSMLGGTCTLVGTSTNLIVDDIFRLQTGGGGFGLFEFAWLGIPYLLIGSLYIVAFGPRLLPERQIVSGMLPPSQRKEYVTEVIVGAASALVGRPVQEVLADNPRLNVLEIVRGEDVFWPPFEGVRIQPEDVLFVRTEPQVIYQAVGSKSFELAPELTADASTARGVEQRLAEVLVLPGSVFAGLPLRRVEFHRRWGVNVLAIQRHGHHLRGRIGEIPLQVGDLLLVQASEESMRRIGDRPQDFAVIDELRHSLVDRRRTPLAVAILGGIVAAAMAGVDLPVAALLGAIAMVVTRCLRAEDAFRSLDGSVLLLIAGTIPLGIAMEKTGLAADLATWLVDHAGSSETLLVGVFYGLTMFLTAALSNNATVSLMTPLAVSTAAALGIDPHPLAIAVAFGGSACFMSPIGYQTNTLVLAPGGYTFADYVRFGLPLNLLLWAAATLLIPVLWSSLPA